MSGEDIRRYTAEELRAMIARGEDRTDWARVDAMTEEELERAIAEDPEWRDVPRDWHKDAVPYKGALPVSRGPKTLLSLRLDPDLVAWFRAQGPGYQTRMNAALRAYMRAARKRTAGGTR